MTVDIIVNIIVNTSELKKHSNNILFIYKAINLQKLL